MTQKPMTRLPAVVLLALLPTACTDPSITNETAASVPRNGTSTYQFAASVSPNSNQVVGVRATIFGTDWNMAPISSGSSHYAVTYFASPCITTIPYVLELDYHKPSILGSGFSSTVDTLRDPPVGGYLLTLLGAPPIGCPSELGHVFDVNSTVDAVDSDLT